MSCGDGEKNDINYGKKLAGFIYFLSKATNDLAKDVDPLVLRLTRSIRDA